MPFCKSWQIEAELYFCYIYIISISSYKSFIPFKALIRLLTYHNIIKIIKFNTFDAYQSLIFKIQIDLLYIINSNSLPHKRPDMPPKKSKKNELRQSLQAQIEVVAIEEHFRRGGDEDEVTDIIRRMDIAYKQNALSLRNSLACFVLKVCGLSAAISKLEFNNINGSILTILTLVQEKKIDFTPDATLLIKQKDPNSEKYSSQISAFFEQLLSEEYQFIKNAKTNNMLINLQQWISILSKSKQRSIRFSSLKLMKLLIQNQTSNFNALLNKKQSKKAIEFVKDVQGYLPLIRERLKDIDTHIRQCLQMTLKDILLNMQTDIADQKTMQSLFLPLLEENRQKILQSTLQTLLILTQKSKKLKKPILAFVKSNYLQIQRISILPNRIGTNTLKLMIELHKLDPQANILHPTHISRIFEYYSLQHFTSGLQIVIDAFYNSIYPTQQELIQNRTVVVIQIMNLINNFNSEEIKILIITQFFQNMKVSFEKIFIVDDLFNILMNQSYSHNGEEIQLKQKDIISWIFIIQTFITYAKKYIDKYQNIQSQKFQKQKEKWIEIGESYNTNLLTNIKSIIHEKMRGDLTRYYLKLMKKIIFPVGIAFQAYFDFMFEKIVAIFQREINPTIYQQIVQIFYNLKSHNIQMLVSSLLAEPRGEKQKVANLLKKIAIIKQFYVKEFVSMDATMQMIKTFKHIQNLQIKEQIVCGLYLVHQWWLNHLLQNDQALESYQEYKNVQLSIIKFLLQILESRNTKRVKIYILKCLLRILQTVCSDILQHSEHLYYNIQASQINLIYNFLSNQIVFPTADRQQSEDQQSKDFTKIMNALSFEQSNNEKTIIPILFNIFQNSRQIATHPFSLKFITGALLAQDQKAQSADLSTSKQNISLSLEKSNFTTIYIKQRYASKYFQKLIQREVLPQNRSTFVFWQIVQEIYKELKGQNKIKESFTSKVMDLYLKKKFGKQAYAVSLNKALIFVVAEIDRIYDDSSFQQFNLIYIICKKLIKKLNKQAARRIFMFIKEKPEPSNNKQDLKNLLNFLDKASKGTTPAEQGENEHQENNQQNEEQIVQNPVNSFQNRRQTRSKSKREVRLRQD